MKAFQVHLYGRHLLTSAVGDEGALSSLLGWSPGAGRRGRRGALLFSVKANEGGPDGRRLDWPIRALAVGDELRIRIVEADRSRPEPREAEEPDPAAMIAALKAMIRGRQQRGLHRRRGGWHDPRRPWWAREKPRRGRRAGPPSGSLEGAA
jgi:hypothetical protein